MAQNFESLDVWKKAKELCLLCYEAIKCFPKEERFGLSDQIRRAAVSIPSNFAEGYSRRSFKDLHHFFDIGIGSTLEVMTQISIANSLNYISQETKEGVYQIAEETIKLARGYLKYKRSCDEKPRS